MAIQIQGTSGVIAEVDGTTFRAIRTVAKPLEYGAFGHYRWGGFTGILPAALSANSEIFQFRWSDPTRFAVIEEILISACVSTTFFAAGVPVQLDMIRSINWTVQGTGGTAPTIGSSDKVRTTMGNSLMAAGDLRIATTAALGAGTKTLDANGMSGLVAPGPITASLNGQIIPPMTPLFSPDIGSGEHPLILAQNEGFSVRSVAVPATGTWTAHVGIRWAEVAAF